MREREKEKEKELATPWSRLSSLSCYLQNLVCIVMADANVQAHQRVLEAARASVRK